MDERIKKLAIMLCEKDDLDPYEEIISGQASGFVSYGERWQAFNASEGQCGERNYIDIATRYLRSFYLGSK